MTYAQGTEVSADRSEAEIRSMIQRRGGVNYGVMFRESSVSVAFILNGWHVRFTLPLPDRDEKRFWRTPARHKSRNQSQAFAEWEKACRECWRALSLAIKAKLVTVDAKISTFEEEFLAYVVNPESGRTVAEDILPQLRANYENDTIRSPLALCGPEGK